MTRTDHLSAIDKCCAILQATRDGNDLAPEHLYLVQTACNGWLSEAGEVAFDALHQQVTSGTYIKPWFRGVEHMMRDHEGYVYWKGQQVEHYSFRDDTEGELAALTELAARCRWLEANQIPVTSVSAIWNWDTNRTEHRQAA